MTDKVQKIKDWISKEQDGLIGAQGNFEYPEHEGAYHILCNLDAYIDSLQEEPVSEDLEEASVEWFNSVKYKSDLSGTPISAFKEGAKWQKVKTLSDVKKAVTGKAIQFSMENVEAWGDDSNGKTIKLKGRVTFHVSNPESIIDALFAELENDN